MVEKHPFVKVEFAFFAVRFDGKFFSVIAFQCTFPHCANSTCQLFRENVAFTEFLTEKSDL